MIARRVATSALALDQVCWLGQYKYRTESGLIQPNSPADLGTIPFTDADFAVKGGLKAFNGPVAPFPLSDYPRGKIALSEPLRRFSRTPPISKSGR